MSYKLSGINPLAYVGVEPITPPQMIVEPRSPTPNDSRGYNLGTYWLVAAPPPTMNWELWILVDLTAGIATWVQLFPGSSGGVIRLDADVGFAIPTLGVINVLGGPNINTFGDMANNLFINLNDAIRLPNTNNTGNAGILYLGATGGVGGQTFLHNYGTDNTFLGSLAGNLTLNVLSATQNVGIGHLSLNSLVTAGLNTAVGDEALSSLQSGAGNVALGSGALVVLVSGSDDICIGTNAGINYTTNESSNILIGNDGVTGESNTIRIGEDGLGAGQQDAAFMAGVFGRSVGLINETVVIDNTGKLGSVVTPPPVVNAAKAFLGILPTDTGVVSGNGAQYLLGTTVAFTTVFDDTGGYFPGDGLGTPSSFTAPVTGKYYLEVQVLPQDTSLIKTTMFWPLIEIITPARTYKNNLTVGSGGSIGGIIHDNSIPPKQTSTMFNIVADLNIGDVVTFQVTANYGLNTMILNGAAYPLTLITGFLIASSSAVTGNGVIVTTFNTSGTWFKDPNTKLVKAIIWNGGAGGGSGGQGLTSAGPNNTWGGAGGGSCNALVTDAVPASFFNASEPVIIGAGGIGGAPQLGVNTPGNNGTVGGVSSLGNLSFPTNNSATYFGRGGILNTTAIATFIGPNNTNNTYYFSNSFTGQNIGTASQSGSGYFNNGFDGLNIGNNINISGLAIFPTWWTGAAGGGGGGADVTTAWAGGNGGGITNIGFPGGPTATLLVSGGAGGIETGTINGANGLGYPQIFNYPAGGLGGGGGGGQSTGLVAGNGGNGGIPGGGGGGGGASLNGTPSGAGGNGGHGMVIVIEYL